MLYVLLALIVLSVWLFCLFDVLTTDEVDIRRGSKFGWFLIVLLTMLAGAVLWLLLGRPRDTSRRRFGPMPSPEPAVDLPLGPDDDPEFLRSLDRRIRGED